MVSSVAWEIISTNKGMDMTHFRFVVLESFWLLKNSFLLFLQDGNTGEDFNKDSIERDERRLTELGRRTLEIFVLAHIFRWDTP